MEIEAATRRMEKRLGKQVQLSFDFENKPELKDNIEKFSDEPSFEAADTTQENTIFSISKILHWKGGETNR